MSKEVNTKDLNYYLNIPYTFTVKPDLDDGGFIAEFSDLQYCVGTGDTIDKAINDAMIAKEGWIKSAYADDIIIPEPITEEFNGRISLRIPKSLHRKINELAKKEGVSANQLLSNLISMGIGRKMKS
jgi:antitoxin HicB